MQAIKKKLKQTKKDKNVWIGHYLAWGVLTSQSFLVYPPQSLRGYIVILVSVRSFVRSFVRPSVRPSPSLIRYSSKTAEQNFMKLSGIVHYMMPYCTSYFKFLGFPRAKQRLCHYDIWGGGPIFNPLLLLDRWTEFHETFRNCLLHDAILHHLF